MAALDSFVNYAQMVGAQVHLVEDDRAAAEGIAGLGEGAIKYPAALGERYPALLAALQQTGAVLVSGESLVSEDQTRSLLGAALAGGVGIILPRAAIGETGSLIVADDGLVPRLLGMLSDVCVAILPADVIVPSLDDAGVLLAELHAGGHRYVSFVTGPSRTADIERVLTIGVQGPKALHVFVLSAEC